MSQDRKSACIPPPSDYSQHSRGPSSRAYAGRYRDGDGGRKFRPHFNSDNYSRSNHHHYKHRPTTFQKDPPRHYDSPAHEEIKPDRVKDQPTDRFHRNDDDDYFARVQDEEQDNESSPTTTDDPDTSQQKRKAEHDDCDSEEEDDPLDAYMKSLENDDTKSAKSCHPAEPCAPSSHTSGISLAKSAPVRLDIDGTEDIEEYNYEFVEKQKMQQQKGSAFYDEQLEDKQDLIEYDHEGNLISVGKMKRDVEPLPPVDHNQIDYDNFEKCLYREHEEIQKLSGEQIEDLRKKLEIKVSGYEPPRPVCSFAHFNFEEKLLKVIRKSEYVQPTPIQAQAIPTALSGRNLIGIAMTGSGKTAAYLWPMIVHISKQSPLGSNDGPIGLVLVPTRELALQVYGEARKFSASYKLSVVCAYGGGSKFEQSRDLEAGAEIVVATPGRLIDLIKGEATNLRRVTYLVLDEADRFFDMGFEAQVRSICDQIRPDRQTLLFSATFKHKVEQLARAIIDNPVRIVQKSLGEANEDVTQHTVVFRDPTKKWDWLLSRLVELTSSGSVLVFVTRISNAQELQRKLEEVGKDSLLLHGDMEQSERNRVIMCFKRKEKDILVATDVAARGLDISHIKTVVNYDVARDIDTHVHRIGRTGRAGSKGDAYTLLNQDKDKEFAGHLVKNLESSNQNVSEDLMKLAMQSHNFRKSIQDKRRNHHKRAKWDNSTFHRKSHDSGAGSSERRYVQN